MLAAKNISKQFSGIKALTDISLELPPGTVTAIIGENGAGKSTLMKILSGVYTDYQGEIFLNDRRVHFSNTKQAADAGIAIIHQELNLIPHLTIMENIFLGRELTNSLGLLAKKKMREQTRTLLTAINLPISPDTKIATLKVGQQQLVEIARALYSDASVIIMDEPTSAISDKEANHLFTIVHQLKKKGKSIAYISHKLKELFALADRYVVLRDGIIVDAGNMKLSTEAGLIHKMTGRNINLSRNTSKENSPELMRVKNVSLRRSSFGNYLLKDVSFSLKKGEIIGIYGLMGAGRSELMETLFGLHPKASGEILIEGNPHPVKSTSDAINAGIALVPEDRKLQGLVLHQNIRKNISITVLNKILDWGLSLNRKKERQLSRDYINRLSIKTSTMENAARNLSGGNQQKIVLAKWLATHPKILLLDEPTRGIDINAKFEIYSLMKSLADQNMGIIIVSSELPEILAVSNRVLVICEGELTASIPIEQANEAIILKHAIQKNQSPAP